MTESLMECILWILAIYGLIDIIRDIFYIFSSSKINTKDTFIIVAVKNQENNIEGFIRNIMFKLVCTKNLQDTKVIVTDLGSSDETRHILEKLNDDYECLEIIEWEECKKILDNHLV